jgi:ATPase subunit of ABC transporter with duplicated ATPase domains
MRGKAITFQDISFSYDTASIPLFEGLSAHFPTGWTGIVGGNGAGKTTILKLATGALKSQQGNVQIPGDALYCPQRTDDIPEKFVDLIEAKDSEAYRIRRRLNIDDEWLERWDTLSHGERKRAQIGVMLWSRPQVLAIDEPTNHLDTEARDMLADALRSFDGIGLLVSHDRELLDTLCRQCLFADPPEAVMRPGGYTQGAEQAGMEEEHTRKQLDLAKDATRRLQRQAARRRESAARARRRLSKRGLDRKDHAAKGKIDLARVTGKDAVDSKRLRQLEGRLKQARETQKQFKIKKTYQTGIWLEGSRSKRNTLFDLPGGALELGRDRELRFENLSMGPGDRIAVTGPNGAGKSTLVRHIVDSLNLPEERVTYLPQEIDLRKSKGIIADARGLPNDQLGHMMTVVSRLGSRPHRLLESDEPSPGEIRKVLLATGIAQTPHLIILDEPTNHLDLPSIECLEDALRDCPCGLLLVSHDQRFLDSLTEKRWHMSLSEGTENVFTLRHL